MPITRDRILDAAMALADAEGIGAVTMRRVANELGVEAMSLYHYVASKDEMLGGLVDRVVDEFELPTAGQPWRPALRAAAISAYGAMAAHPWAAALTLSSRTLSPGRFRYMNALLRALEDAGLTPRQTDHAYHVLEGHIMGFTLWEQGMNLGSREDLAGLATRVLATISVEDYPFVGKHIEQHLEERDPADEGSFVFGLDLILDGLERLRK